MASPFPGMDSFLGGELGKSFTKRWPVQFGRNDRSFVTGQ